MARRWSPIASWSLSHASISSCRRVALRTATRDAGPSASSRSIVRNRPKSALPGLLREDTVPSHDYLSLAVEFANGLDLTYYWSRALPVGSAYWCPLANWKRREFHVVVRSGEDGLGAWRDERRDLHADALRYFGVHPGDVVRVWLIAVSVFKRQHGRCAYAGIELGNRGEKLAVL